MSLLLRAPVTEDAFPGHWVRMPPWDVRQRPWANFLGYDVTSVFHVAPKSSRSPQVTSIGWLRSAWTWLDGNRWENEGGPGGSEEWCSRTPELAALCGCGPSMGRIGVDHERVCRSRCSRAIDDFRGRSLAEGEPVDFERVGIGRFRPAGSRGSQRTSPATSAPTWSSGCEGRGLTIRKLPSGRWFAVLKSGRAYVSGRTFDTRRDAQAWLAREQAALAGG